jgi:hypothetical protein
MNLRGYEGYHDLAAMLDLLSEGRRAQNDTYYIHRGDLQSWLFYTDVPEGKWQSNIRLWTDEDDRLIGWALLSLDEKAFDVYTIPSLRGDPRESEMLESVVEEMSALDTIQTIWIAENDGVRIQWLEAHGFKLAENYFIHFERSLSELLGEYPLPNGFFLRSSHGAEDARQRAVASHAAFGSKKPFEEYWPRTLRFVQSPVYAPEH